MDVLLVVILIVESYILYLLAILLCCCPMEKGRKRKRDDLEAGPNGDETEVLPHDKQCCSFRPKGIPNVGASCFMNSMLQCLFWSPCLRKQLEHQIEKMQPKYQGKLATTFLKLLQLNQAEGEVKAQAYRKDVKKFCKELAKEKDNFNGLTQEDSFEFYNTLISGLEEEALRNVPFRPIKDTVTTMEHIMGTCDVTRLFGGTFMTSYCYKECGHVEPVFQRFTSLSLPPIARKKITEDTAEATFANKRQAPQETSSVSVQPKKHRLSPPNAARSDVTTTWMSSSRRSTRIVDERTRLVRTPDTQMKKNKEYGALSQSQKPNENNENKPDVTSINTSDSNPLDNSDISEKNIDMSSLYEHLPGVQHEELDLQTLRSSNTNRKAVGTNKADGNDTDPSTARPEVQQEQPDLQTLRSSNKNRKAVGTNKADCNDTDPSTARPEVQQEQPDLQTLRSSNKNRKAVGTNKADGNDADPGTTRPDVQNEQPDLQTLRSSNKNRKAVGTNKADGNDTNPSTARPEVQQEQPDLQTLRSSNKNWKSVGTNKADGNDTDPSTTRSEVYDQAAQNNNDRESISNECLDDLKKLKSMRLGSRKKKSKRLTGLELSLGKWTEFEKIMAADLPCRTCSDKKGPLVDTENYDGVLYKQTQLVSLPHVLVLHINRFEQKGRHLYKVEDFISYPKFLDMTYYCSNALQDLELDNDKLTNGRKYSLFGVVNHQGSMRGGHYSAYIKTNKRDAQRIQKELQNSWKDPEDMESSIRTHLEEIWQVKREIDVPADKKKQRMYREDVDSQNGEKCNVVQQKTDDRAEEVGHNERHDQHDVGDSKERHKQDGNQDLPLKDHEVDLVDQQDNKNDHVLQRDGEKYLNEAGKNYQGRKKKMNKVPQEKDGTISVCLSGQNSSALDDIRRNYAHEEGHDSVHEEDKNCTVGRRGPTDGVHGEDTTDICRLKRQTDDVHVEMMTYHGRKKGRMDAVQEEGKDDCDRKKGPKDTIQEEGKLNPDRTTEHHKDTVPEEDINRRGKNKCGNNAIKQNDSDSVSDGKDNNLIDKEEHLNGVVHKREHESCNNQKGDQDPDQTTGEQDGAQKKRRKVGVQIKGDTDDVDVGGEKDSVKTRREKNGAQRRSRKRPRKDKKDIQQDVEQGVKLDDHISTHKNSQDVVYCEEEKTPTNKQERRGHQGKDTWFYVSDSCVQTEKESTVFKSTSAYILMYERI